MKNIKENATLNLVSIQNNGEENEKMEFSSRGSFNIRNGKKYITYKEHSDMGMGDSSVMLKIEKDLITMRRTGEFATVMVYDIAKVTEFIYRVPFGTMNMKIKTLEIRDDLSEDGGELAFSYLLFVNGETVNTEIKICVKTERN